MHTPGLGLVWGSKHSAVPTHSGGHYAVLPTKTSLMIQLVHWDVPSLSSGFLFFSLDPCSMSCHFSRFPCSVHVAGESFIALPVPLILIFS